MFLPLIQNTAFIVMIPSNDIKEDKYPDFIFCSTVLTHDGYLA